VSRITPLHAAALACHAALLAAVGTLAFAAAAVSPWRALAAALACAPLLACVPGLLAANRTTALWLAVLLVAYCGAASVEVVATAGGSLAASIALLASLVELGVALTLIRRWRRPQAARG
jgi:uncharacterized membrane protein